ncbi:hypothetical protein [Actinocrispum wychmicini]|uniref:Uncharacterized protein n=1 Tax=Actinocrispum wychmicini TaxID=1213861 RepID=A0A4R2JBM4_9PSEU|nr:hypothetical protein [Actinocrispum wychmicini]TCO56891.1 hypothetical protein EV192_106366 [Actinocrispum wychmicini]
MITVVIFEYLSEDGLRDVRRTRDLTSADMGRFGPSWGRDAAGLLHDQWMVEDRGPGYYRVRMQEERGVHVRLLAEAGERREDPGGMTTSLTLLVTAVRAHAKQHYTVVGGWDVVVECWEDRQIVDVLAEERVTTVEEAIAVFASLVSVWAGRQAGAENSAF